MSYRNLLLDLRPPLAVLAIHRPKVLNALNAETIAELAEAVAALAAEDAVRVVILTGAGEKAFVAGADIGELTRVDSAEGEQLSRRGQRVFRAIEQMGKPVIAAINGFALGGGCELAMACTLRIAADSARLGQPEVKLGLIPGYGGTQRLPRLVGRGAALRLLLTGEMISAEEARRIGLVEEVVPAAALMAHVEALARTMAAGGPLAVRETLAALDQGLDRPLDEALEAESVRFGRCCGSPEKQEGTRAFLEKREPRWGRP